MASLLAPVKARHVELKPTHKKQSIRAFKISEGETASKMTTRGGPSGNQKTSPSNGVEELSWRLTVWKKYETAVFVPRQH